MTFARITSTLRPPVHRRPWPVRCRQGPTVRVRPVVGSGVTSPTVRSPHVSGRRPRFRQPHSAPPRRPGGQGVRPLLTGRTSTVALGEGSAPHGVIVGPDGAPVGDRQRTERRCPSGPGDPPRSPLPAAVRPPQRQPQHRRLRQHRGAVVHRAGWCLRATRAGIGSHEVFDAPRGRGPYGITATPDGSIFYASSAGNHIAHLDVRTSTQR